MPPGTVIEKAFFLEAFPAAAESSGFSRPLRTSVDLFAPFDEGRFPRVRDILRAKLAYARTRWIDRGDVGELALLVDGEEGRPVP